LKIRYLRDRKTERNRDFPYTNTYLLRLYFVDNIFIRNFAPKTEYNIEGWKERHTTPQQPLLTMSQTFFIDH